MPSRTQAQPTPFMKAAQIFGLGSYILPKNTIFLQEAFLYQGREDGGTNSLATFLGYGLTEHISVDIGVPYVASYRLSNLSTSGLSKISNRINIDLYNYKTDASEFHFVGFNILRYPTAKTDSDLPLGDGCYEDYVGGTFTYDTPNYGVYFANSYGFTNTWKNFKHGAQWGTVLIASYKPYSSIMIQLEFSGFLQADDIYSGQKIPNSAESLFLICPNIRIATNHVHIVAGFGLPVHRKNHSDNLCGLLGLVCFF